MSIVQRQNTPRNTLGKGEKAIALQIVGKGESIAESFSRRIKREHAAENRQRRKKRKETLEALARLTYEERRKMLRRMGVRI